MSANKKVVILGGGLGGLSAGYYLSRTNKFEVTVLEKAQKIGGVCGSFKHNGFILDYGAHKIYSVIPGILDEIRNLMGDRLLQIPKKNRIFLRGHLLDYPLKLGNLAQALGMGTFVGLGLGYAASLIEGLLHKKPATSYEEYIIQRFGKGTYSLVFEPLADKVWGDPATLHDDMARTRVPASGGMDVILRLLGIKKESKDTSAEYFYYPRKGYQDFPDVLKEKIQEMGGKVIENVETSGIECANSVVKSVNTTIKGETNNFPCDYLISSIPIPVIGRLLFSENDKEFINVAGKLQFRNVVLVYIFVKKPLILEDQWIFFPERKYIFSRIFEQKQMNIELGTPDETAICCDFTCTDESWQWKADDRTLADKCIEGLVESGFVQKGEVYDFHVVRFPNFYPRYDLHYKGKINNVMKKLRQIDNLLLTGRIGMYNYNNADHCMDMGKLIAEGLENGKTIGQIWEELIVRTVNYRIVD